MQNFRTKCALKSRFCGEIGLRFVVSAHVKMASAGASADAEARLIDRVPLGKQGACRITVGNWLK